MRRCVLLLLLACVAAALLLAPAAARPSAPLARLSAEANDAGVMGEEAAAAARFAQEDAAAFLEADAEVDAHADADADAEADAEAEAEADAEAEAEAEAESESSLGASACAANSVRSALVAAVNKQRQSAISTWNLSNLKVAESLTRAAQVQANAKFSASGPAFNTLVESWDISSMTGYAHIINNVAKKSTAAIVRESIAAWVKAQQSTHPWPLANSPNYEWIGVGYAVVGGKGYLGFYATDSKGKAIGKAASVKC